MANHEKRNRSTAFYVILTIVIIAILCLVLYFILNKDAVSTISSIFQPSIKNETITAENYDEIMDRIENEFNQDDEELYYLSYAMMYHILNDGISSAFSNTTDENAMYASIYEKTVGQLIEEGKQLMEDNNVTIEQYKEGLENLNSINS